MSTSCSEARVDGADECARGRHLKKRATRHFVAHKTPKEARVGGQYTPLLSLSERLTQLRTSDRQVLEICPANYLVTNRQTEFGIRMTLGADRASILRLVMRDGAIIIAGGVASGLAVGFASVKLLQRMLIGLEPREPVTMVTAVCLRS